MGEEEFASAVVVGDSNALRVLQKCFPEDNSVFNVVTVSWRNGVDLTERFYRLADFAKTGMKLDFVMLDATTVCSNEVASFDLEESDEFRLAFEHEAIARATESIVAWEVLPTAEGPLKQPPAHLAEQMETADRIILSGRDKLSLADRKMIEVCVQDINVHAVVAWAEQGPSALDLAAGPQAVIGLNPYEYSLCLNPYISALESLNPQGGRGRNVLQRPRPARALSR